MPKGVYQHKKGGNAGSFKKGQPKPKNAYRFPVGHKLGVNNKWNLGKKRLDITGHNNFNWKGHNVGYLALHSWIYRNLGKPNKCSNPDCVYPRLSAKNKLMIKPKRYHWANLDHKYKRNLTDWVSFCVSCHKKYDLKYNFNK